MSYGFVVARTQRRRAEWERVFGADRLPVLDIRPRRAVFREGPVWVFDVAVGRLHVGQVNRLAGRMARRRGVGYEVARRMVLSQGLTVRAEDVVVVETAAGPGYSSRLCVYGSWW